MSLKVIYMGTPDFAVPALESIIKAGHEVVAVYSQPPRPAGRGYKVIKCPVQNKAEELGLKVYTPETLKAKEVQQKFAKHNADIAVVAAYGKILPKEILESPRGGCLNIHASLLPRWRGAAPIQRAILAGDKETGITIMQMDEGLDTGDMLLQDTLPITASTIAAELHDRLADLGASMIVDTLEDFEKGILDPQPQPLIGITYAEKLTKGEGLINWKNDAVAIERQVRALNPWPGAYFEFKGKKIKVLESEICHLHIDGNPGEILDEQLTIACGKNSIRILRLQKEGSRVMIAREFLNGCKIVPGDIL